MEFNEQTIRTVFDQIELNRDDKFQSYKNLDEGLNNLLEQAFDCDHTELVPFIYSVYSEKINSIGTRNDFLEYINLVNPSKQSLKRI